MAPSAVKSRHASMPQAGESPRRVTPLRVWFALATFSCSALIFWVEPLVGKQLLPLVGGVPAVWNVCLLFFQLALLAGYATAHGLTRLTSARAQAGVYLLIALAAAVLLPVEFGDAPFDATRPVAWLLGQLSLELLLPFIVLAAAAPLLQHWYSRTAAASAGDPYFLYAASNAGSLIALLAFPLLLEPTLRIRTQNSVWAVAFVIAVIVAAATALWSRRPAPAVVAAAEDEAPPRLRELARWALLAAVPSSLLMGATTYITSDIAPVPLLWVVPLGLYLLTFILAFGWYRGGLPATFGRIMIMLAAAWCTLYRLDPTEPLPLLVFVHVTVFAVLALGVHVRLAQQRPAASQLTVYYLAIAAGGALGGTFNALIAPAIFDSHLEYPLAALAAIWLNLPRQDEPVSFRRDVAPVLLLTGVIAAVMFLEIESVALHSIITVALPVAIAYVLSERRVRYALALGVILLSARFDPILNRNVLHAERNFYGLLRVTTDDAGRFHELRHGNTLHGAIDVTRAGGSEPLSYYWLGSPVAEVLGMRYRLKPDMDVAVVGLGVGALAWYGRPGQQWTFYEINPAVIELASDTTMFHFLAKSPADSVALVLGDARLELRNAPDSAYDVIVLDAFTSDAIPMHILTQEAIGMYLRKLRHDGVLVFHISNRYLDLAPPIAATGATHGLHAFVRAQQVDEAQAPERVESSEWLVMVREVDDFALVGSPLWTAIDPAEARPWTDDYSNIWSAFIR